MLRHLKFSLCLFPFSSCPLSFCLCPSLLALSLSTSHSWYFFFFSLGFTLPEFVSFSVSSQSLFMIISILASLGLISVLFSLCFRFLCVSFSHSCSSLFNFFPFWLSLRATCLPRCWLSLPWASILSPYCGCSVDRGMAAGLCALLAATWRPCSNLH